MSLPLGYGAPLVRVFNAKGTEVFDRVTAFSYMHSEKTNDSSRIVIETDDIPMVDHPDLQEGKILKLVFGYSGGRVRVHKVWIWDVTAQFNEQGVRLEVIAYCKAAYMKLNSSQETYNNASLVDVAAAMAKKNGLNAKVEGPSSNLDPTYNGPTSSVFNVGRYDADTGEFGKHAYVTAARESTAVPLVVHNLAEDRFEEKFEYGGFKHFKGGAVELTNSIAANTNIPNLNSSRLVYTFKKHEAVPQANASDATQLDRMAALEPTDNIVIEGRDDELIIKKRNLSQKPFKSYTYRAEPGNLLEFVPAVRNTMKRKRAVAVTTGGWQDDVQKYFQGTVDNSTSSAPLLGDSVEIPREIPDEVDGLASLEYKESSDNGRDIEKEINKEKLEDGREWTNVTKYGVARRPEIIDFSLKNIKTLTPVDSVALEFPIAFPKEHIPSVETTKKDAAGQAVNRQAKQQAEIEECTAKFLGDPDIQSGKIVTIMNAGKKYSGNYYIISAEHNISPNAGYIVDCVLFRNGKKKMNEDDAVVNGEYINRIPNKEPTLPFDGTFDLNEIPVTTD